MLKGVSGQGGAVTYGAITATSINFGGSTLSTYTESNFTGSYTGYSTVPTSVIDYVVVGKLVTIQVNTDVSATSNLTTKTITGMPAAIFPLTAVNFVPLVIDNGGTGVASFGVIGTDGVITLYKDADGGAWTGSGTATIRKFTVSYTLL